MGENVHLHGHCDNNTRTRMQAREHACRHAHTNGFESDGPMNGLRGKRKSDRRSPSMQCATATWW